MGLRRIRAFPKSPGTGTGEYRVLNITKIIENGADCYPWREVYAWWPVKTISGQRIWRERVFKRRVWLVWGASFHMEPEVQYATLFDLLTVDYNAIDD